MWCLFGAVTFSLVLIAASVYAAEHPEKLPKWLLNE